MLYDGSVRNRRALSLSFHILYHTSCFKPFHSLGRHQHCSLDNTVLCPIQNTFKRHSRKAKRKRQISHFEKQVVKKNQTIQNQDQGHRSYLQKVSALQSDLKIPSQKRHARRNMSKVQKGLEGHGLIRKKTLTKILNNRKNIFFHFLGSFLEIVGTPPFHGFSHSTCQMI